MFITSLRSQEEDIFIAGKLAAHSILALAVSFAVATVLWSGWWQAVPGLWHTVTELLCIIIALSLFIIVCHTYEINSPTVNFLGLGFLTAAVFQLFHTLYSPELGFNPKGYLDLGTRYWMCARLTQAFILLIAALKIFRRQVNKWAGVGSAFIVPLLFSLVILKYPGILPALYIEGYGATPAKAYAELFVIILSLITLFALGKDVKNRDVLTYKYIFISVMIAVTTDISLALYESKLSFIRAFGHVSKTAFFLYLFRGTVSSAIRYPYKELENAHTYLSKILNGLPIGLLTFDYDRNLISANTAAQKMLGYTRDGQTGLPEEEFSKKAYSIIKDLTAKNSGNQDLSGKIVKAENLQGENINLRVSVQNFGDGNYMYLLAEAKREQELENLQLQTQTVLNALTNLVLMMDKNRKIIMCNKALSETFHIPEKDVLGMDISEFGDMVNCSRREILLRRPKPNDGPREKAFEASFITPLGEKREVVFHFAPVYNIETELIGYICIGVDVTTMKTEQEKLRQQEKLAVLGQMAAGLVHEIKNPLTAIRGFSQIIKNETLDDRIRQYADIMETEADCVNGVVSDFLAFAKPRPPALRPLSLNRLVNSMSLMLESQFFIKGIKLKIEISPEEKPVMLDEDQIKQVILNMVRNAIDASSDAKEPQVVLKTEYKGDSEEMAVIISDNGRGISPEEMVNIGTPFYTTKDKGTGLGLSICFQIVKQHSGRIDIDARIGVGSTFSIMLPYIRHN